MHPDATVPEYMAFGNDGFPAAIGMDVRCVDIEYKEDIDTIVFHTGLAFELPVGYGMMICPRSSNRKTNLYMPNSPGWLDHGYNEELLVCFKMRDSKNISTVVAKLAGQMEAIKTYIVEGKSREYVASAFRNLDDLCSKSKVDIENLSYKVGDRIAQIIIFPHPFVEFVEVDEIEGCRGGFGSTGNK